MTNDATKNARLGRPSEHGLYDPANEKDSCGVGFVADMKGRPSHSILLEADHALRRMDHRGGCGCEANTGDGCGILTAMPDKFFRKIAKAEFGVDLPARGRYAVGNVFLPAIESEREKCKALVNKIIAEQGQKLIGWLELPVEPIKADVGPTATASMPTFEQLFIAAGDGVEGEDFERQLYIIRKSSTRQLRYESDHAQADLFYICTLSSKVIVYKGMLTTSQLLPFYLDLRDSDFETHLAMVHSRFSTNTFPSWDRAQPNRFLSHNGEINTRAGNINWMHAREGVVKSELFDEEINKLFPIVEPDCSDSGNFDNVVEFMLMSGRTLQEAMMLMIPEAWQNDDNMSAEKRAFYEYNSMIMEPWDGPASMVFTDGHYIGAVLDRNGLRPSRYYITHDDKVIMASEVGVIEVDPANVKFKGRLQPGKMFLLDFEEGRLIDDSELKNKFATARPYGEWIAKQKVEFSDLHTEAEPHGFEPETLISRMRTFGYTNETMQFMLLPLVEELRDPVNSMGNDSALACLSDKPRMIYDYFKQLFAQVTNPAIDSIREEVVMSLECYIGPEGNLLEATEQHAHRLRIPHPILTNEEMAALRHIDYKGWTSTVIDITYPKSEGKAGLQKALQRFCDEASAAIAQGNSLVILSDRAVGADRIPVSTLLAAGCVHHH
ncbi:MAG TPA: glutamate synthase central domain-containing protein, partial [Spongiibacteraceae bacterium]|nr:glutamate synthase central domain-containing protein [Spongiibacteraceae bacterium]